MELVVVMRWWRLVEMKVNLTPYHSDDSGVLLIIGIVVMEIIDENGEAREVSTSICSVPSEYWIS